MDTPTMRCHVLFFAHLADVTKVHDSQLDLADGSSVRELLDQIEQRYPDTATLRREIAVAVNEQYCKHDHTLRDGDVVALVPPVSGG